MGEKKQGIPNGIFREAARTFLRVKRVWVHRIREISEAEALAEGCASVDEFCDLWESLYPGSWERNDYVWAEEHELTAKPEYWPEV